MTPLERATTMRFVNTIKGDLARAYDNFLDSVPLPQIKAVTERYLETLVRCEAIKSFRVSEPANVFRSWEDLYPSRNARFLARLAKLVGVHPEALTQKWYHTIFPFQVTYVPCVNRELLDSGVPVEECLSAYYSAHLSYPGWVVTQDFSICPAVPVEEIKMNFVIGAPSPDQRGLT